MYTFDRSNLPFNNQMNNFWDINGYLVIENFYLEDECNSLISQAENLIYNFVSFQNIFL